MAMNSKLKSALGWVIYLVILVVLVYGVPKGLAYVLKTPYPMASITSGSMWPALKTGDMVFIQGVHSKEELKVGDIVVYRNPSESSEFGRSFTIHRVVKLGADTLTTQGDANNVEDPPVSYEELIGKAVTFRDKPFRIPYLGYVSILINKGKMQ
jgi:signal peptidase